MNAYLQLTLAQLRLFIRNRQVLFWSLFFPIFFMLMLGSFLGSGATQASQGIVIDLDHSAHSKQLEQALLSQSIVQLKKGTDVNKAKETIKSGKNQFVVVIPQNYGKDIPAKADGSRAKVNIYYDQTNMAKVMVGEQVINQVIDSISKKMEHYQPLIQPNYIGMQGLHLRFIDFLVPGIVGMMIMNNNLNGVAGQISSWRERGVLRRMQGTTLKSSTFIAAQITARLLLNGLQAVLVLLVGNLVYGTQVNGSWFLLIGFVILGTLAFMSAGFIIAGLAKTPESAGPIAGFISFPLLFLGGVFFPVQNMPAFLQPIVKALPITQLTTALRQIMNVGADLSTLWSQGLLLFGWMLAAFIVASFTFKWE